MPTRDRPNMSGSILCPPMRRRRLSSTRRRRRARTEPVLGEDLAAAASTGCSPDYYHDGYGAQWFMDNFCTKPTKGSTNTGA